MFQGMSAQSNSTARHSHSLTKILHWLGGHAGATMVALTLITGSVWGFVELADEVTEGDTQAVDEKLLLALRNPADTADPIGPHWVEELGRDLTALGGVGILTLLTLSILGFLLLRRQFHASLYLALSVGGGMLASSLLKMLFARPRPDLVAHGSYVYTTSFPSGHSMMSTAVFFTLAALLASLESSLRIRAYLLSIAALFSFLVGVSRVYLGVHWPSDVLAGWTAGVAWALLCWLIAQRLQQRRYIEGPS